MMPLRIHTERLELVAAEPAMVRSEIAADGTLGGLLSAQVAAGWPCEYWDRQAMEWTLGGIERGDLGGGWGAWYWILRPPFATRRLLVGNGGFKGPPTPEGTVEIGYSIVPSHRRQGLATEAGRGLMTWALRDPRVQAVIAETYPHLTPSIGVMRKLGMQLLGAGSEAGVIRYGVRRDEFPTAQGG
jgi:RimJ/RimL family protein N-acetyltransferase